MPRKCSICAHARWSQIRAVHRGGATYPAIVAEFEVTLGSLSRHFNNPACLRRWEAVEEPQPAVEAIQPNLAVEVRKVVGGGSVAIPAARMRERVGSQPPTPDRSVQPVALTLPVSRLSNVVQLRQPAQTAAEPARTEQEPSLQHLASLMSLGYTDEQIKDQFGWGAEKVATAIERVGQAKRAVLHKSREDWGATFVYSLMDRLAGYRRKLAAAEAGLRHRDAMKYEAMIAAGERDLFTMLERLGVLGPIDPASLGEEAGVMSDLLSAVRNAMDGVFEPEEPRGKTTPLIR